MVAHGGTSVAGSFIQTLTMVDVATGWTECLPLVTRDGSLCLDIDLCVDPRGVVALMSQQLTDLRQCCAGPEKLGGEAVSEDMGPLVGVATDAGTIESGLGDHGDRAARRKTDIGCGFR
jgi:hypothetical protein